MIYHDRLHGLTRSRSTALLLVLFLISSSTSFIQSVQANTEQINFATRHLGSGVVKGTSNTRDYTSRLLAQNAVKNARHDGEGQNGSQQKARNGHVGKGAGDDDDTLLLWPGIVHTETLPPTIDNHTFSYTFAARLQDRHFESSSASHLQESRLSSTTRWIRFVHLIVGRWNLNVSPGQVFAQLLSRVAGGKAGDPRTTGKDFLVMERYWTARISWPATSPADVELSWRQTDDAQSSATDHNARSIRSDSSFSAEGILIVRVSRSGVDVPFGSSLRLSTSQYQQGIGTVAPTRAPDARSKFSNASPPPPLVFDILIEPLLFGVLPLTCLPTVIMVLVMGGVAWWISGWAIGWLEREFKAEYLGDEKGR